MKENDGFALTLGVIGTCLSGISLIVCGWLGFIGAFLGIVASIKSTEKASKVLGIVAMTIGLVGGIIWGILAMMVK